MRRGWAALLFFLLLAPSASAAGYKEHLEEWRRFQFPLPAPPPAPPETKASAAEEREFRAEVAKLEGMKQKWEEALAGPVPRSAVFRPEAERLAPFRKTAEDSAAAARVLSAPFTAGDLEILAFLRNRDIRRAAADFRAALEGFSQAANLDEILRQYSAFTAGIMAGVGPMGSEDRIEMNFPFPGILAIKGQIVAAEAEAAWEELEKARRRLLAETRKAYWNLSYVHRAKEITRKTLGLVSQAEEIAATRYGTGKATFQELVRVQIERERLEEDLRTLGQERHNVEVGLLNLLDLPPTTPLAAPRVSEPEREIPGLERLYAGARENRQELRAQRASIRKMERMIALAEKNLLPSYSLNLSLFSNQGIVQAGSGRTEEAFSVSVPAYRGSGLPNAPWFGSNNAYLREIRAKLKAAEEKLAQSENETLSGVRENWFRWDLAIREEALYSRRVLPRAEAAFEASRRGYETGILGFAEWIASYNEWLSAGLSLERSRRDAGVSRAEMLEMAGFSWEAERK